MRLIECVPNVSEGRDRTIIDAIAAAVSSVSGVDLLDVDPGGATNRTVFTFVGAATAVEEASVALVACAADLIDMRAHTGAHPRMGAVDVCPFVPIGDTTMAECVEAARRVGKRIAEAHQLPVYLYEEAASSPHRRSLAAIRQGEYEGLTEKLRDPLWAPDFGPARPNPRMGATAVGAREFLIAYNVNLNSTDRRIATRIAQEIRETGRPQRDGDGRIVRDARGEIQTEPGDGCLPAVRATGWYIEEYGRAQVSINLTGFRVTPPHVAFEAVDTEARKRGVRVTGSEVIGLIPLDALRAAGRYYLGRQGMSPAVPEKDLVAAAVSSLGLSEMAPFESEKKIIEYRVAPPRPLLGMSVARFCDTLSAATPAPGGGSAAALMGSLAAGLAAMVAGITHDKKGKEEFREELVRLGEEAHAIKARLALSIDEDAAAFDSVLAAHRLPRADEAQTRARDAAIQEATREAIRIPLEVMRNGVRVLELTDAIAVMCVRAAMSDIAVAGLAAAAAVEGAGLNVGANLPGLTDAAKAARCSAEAMALRERAGDLAARVAGRAASLKDVPQSSPAK